MHHALKLWRMPQCAVHGSPVIPQDHVVRFPLMDVAVSAGRRVINQLVQYGAPLMVVEGDSGKFVGVITNQSALDELQRLKDSDS